MRQKIESISLALLIDTADADVFKIPADQEIDGTVAFTQPDKKADDTMNGSAAPIEGTQVTD